MNKGRFKKLIQNLYTIVRELEGMFPGRRFTLDGHMVGSIGEAFADYHYGVELYPPSHKVHDGVADGVQIQIKTTQKTGVEIKHKPDKLLVFKLEKDGDLREIYNGDGKRVWGFLSKKKPNDRGEKSISISQLSKLNREVPVELRIPRARD
jgi:hypothetical protein